MWNIKLGYVKFIRTDDTHQAGDYYKNHTFPIQKVNKFHNNNYKSYCGWRGADVIESTWSQGYTDFKVRICSSNSTNIIMECFVSVETRLNFINANYLLVHEALWSSQLFYGIDYSSPTNPAHIPTGVGVVRFPQTTVLDLTAYRYIIIINHLDF
jgi:hypothetical protein